MEFEGSQTADILLVDDNPGDVRLVEETFKDGQFLNEIHIARDGQEALDFVNREGEYEDAPRPDIVLLDLYLPKVDGEDVLHEIKHHPDLEDVPVVILSGVDDDYIKNQDLDHDADEDAVLQKPLDISEFLDTVRELDGFRLSVVRTEN